ncbi:hypothetical protein CR513_59539, partial [Mucuna pruriens]
MTVPTKPKSSHKFIHTNCLQMGDEWQHSHVPKYGNWDNDSIPYTVYFEKARNKKALINPNDPEENPEVFNL